MGKRINAQADGDNDYVKAVLRQVKYFKHRNVWRYRGIVGGTLDSHSGSIPTIAQYFCPSARHFIHITALILWGPGWMRMVMYTLKTPGSA